MAMTEASREVGVVVRRRSIDNPWIDHVWSPAMILDEVPATAPWTVLSTEADATIYYAGAASIDLFSSETANYRDNLADGAAAHLGRVAASGRRRRTRTDQGHRRSDRRGGDVRKRLRRDRHRADAAGDRVMDRGLCRSSSMSSACSTSASGIARRATAARAGRPAG